MIPIKELINKLKWDERYNPREYTFFYHDRVRDELVAVDYDSILRIESNFMVIMREGEETNIPMHRIRKVMKGYMLVWRRKEHLDRHE